MTPRTRNCYDTSLIYLIMLNKENLLSTETLRAIPASTKATWKTYSKNKFVGNDQQQILNEGIRTVELYQKYRHIKKVLSIVEIIYSSVSDMLSTCKQSIYRTKENKNKILDLISLYKNSISLEKLLIIFKISRSTYQSWILDIKVKCSASYFEQCVRRYGTQLLKSQVELINTALTNDDFKHWPVASIAYYYQREGLLQASLNTWYKYSKLLGIKRRRIKKHIKKIGIVSTRPNEYWHIDITHCTTNDDIKHYVYFLSDNFSRKILAWRVAFEVSWTHVKECIEEAYEIASAMEMPLNLNIVTDGGPENTHHSLNEYVASLFGNIKKSIALKDIVFSNSPAEAKNKTFKSYYFDSKDTENTKQLNEKIIFFVNDFNDKRPTQALKGFTPNEVYTNTKPELNFVTLRKEDAVKRKESNKNNICNACEILR